MLSDNADIVSCNFKFYYSKDNFFESARVRKLDIVNNKEDDCGRLYNGYHGAYVWRKLYRTEIIKKIILSFMMVKLQKMVLFRISFFICKKNCFHL
jgi:hypothetical protein